MAKTEEELTDLIERAVSLADELSTLSDEELDFVAGGSVATLTCGKACKKGYVTKMAQNELDQVVGGFGFSGETRSRGKGVILELLKGFVSTRSDKAR